MGTMSKQELILHRRIHRAFIRSDYVMVSFNRMQNVSDGAGGRTKQPATFSVRPQMVRVVPARSRSTSMIYTLPTGETVSSKDSMLIGEWDLDVQIKDWFMYEGMAFQVSFIRPERSTETLCQLDLLGPSYRSTV